MVSPTVPQGSDAARPAAVPPSRRQRLQFSARRLGAWVVEVSLIAVSAGVPYSIGAYARDQLAAQPVPLNPVLADLEAAIAQPLGIPAHRRSNAVAPLTNLFWTAALIAPLAVGGLQFYLLAVSGRTSPKRWFGVKVVTAEGQPPGLLRAIAREGVGRWGLPLGLAYGIWRFSGAFPELRILGGLAGLLLLGDGLSGLVHPQGRAFHDRLAGTYPLDLNALPAGSAWDALAAETAGPGRGGDRNGGTGAARRAGPQGADIVLTPQPAWPQRGLWFWMRQHPGATLVVAAGTGLVLVLGTYAATQVYAQNQVTVREFKQQDKDMLLSLVGKYSQNAPDERRGAILALGSARDPNPEILLLVNLLGQEDNPVLVETLHQAIASTGPAALPYLRELNQALKTDLESLTAGNASVQERNRAALRLRATQRAIAKVLRVHGPGASGTDLSRADLGRRTEGAAQFALVLDGANLGGANLRSAILGGARLRGVQFRGAGPDGRFGTFDDATADLSGADLREADLTGANLTDAALRRTSLVRAALNKTDLTRADLTGANFSSAQMVEANFQDAKLEGASLTGADLGSANLTGANLYGATLGQAQLANAQFVRADLSDASFHGSDLSGADLSQAIAEEADLGAAKLANANLRGARLQQASFREADLTQVDLRDADLAEADFQGARFAPADPAESGEFVERAEANTTSAIVEGVDFSRAQNLDDRQLAYICAHGGVHPQCSL